MAKKYKPRKSRLDPYIDEITDMLSTGCTYQQIADAMSEHFDTVVPLSNIYSLVHSRACVAWLRKVAGATELRFRIVMDAKTV